MSEIKSPRGLYEVIGELKESMITRFPDEKEQIETYADNAPKAIDMFLKYDRSLDEICAFFRQFDQIHSGKMHPDVQREIEAMRLLLGDQIKRGNILMPNQKNS